MDTIVDTLSAGIAAQIRQEREARNWSLSDLADHSGVAKASISKIERNEMSPSAVILSKLATAFGLTLAGLLLRVEGEKAGPLRAADQPVWRDPATGYTRKQIFARSSHAVELVEVKLPPGRHVSFPAESYARVRHVVWVQDGRLNLTEGGQEHELHPGDCLGFGPPSPVTYANTTKKTCRYIVALARS